MKQPVEVRDISGGISFYSKRANKAFQVAWLRSIDYRTDPNRWTLLPKTTRESGSTVPGMVKFMERAIPRTDIATDTTELVSNTSFESNTTGWDLDADYTRSSTDAYEGTYSVKQVSTTGYANFNTAAVGGGVAVEAYSDYEVTFRRNVTVTSGLSPLFQVNTVSAFGGFIVGSYVPLYDTAGAWDETTVTINTGSATAIWLRIFNNNGAVTAYYDKFSVTKIRKSSTYMYDDLGNFIERVSTGSYNLLKQISESHGNGLTYFAEDDFVYYMRDKKLGRYGPLSYSTPNFVDDFLGSEGGVPTNTHSLNVVAASSHYADAADSASLSVTGDLTIETYIKPISLPAVGSRMGIVSKWDESGTTQSYILELYGVSGSFGSGANGAVTISSDTTNSPIDSACSCAINSNTLYATNVSFAADQLIYIHQSRGTGAGTYQKTKIQSYTAGVITTVDSLNFDYNSTGQNKAQVLVRSQYTDVTINTTKTWTAKAWNGTVGGILSFVYNGTYTNNGTISAAGRGYRGGSAISSASQTGQQGEGTTGTAGTQSRLQNGSGGGGGPAHSASTGGGGAGQGAGGGNYTVGQGVFTAGAASSSIGGDAVATSAKSLFGGGGGSGGTRFAASSGTGGAGGGIIEIDGATLINAGTIQARGLVGTASATSGNGHGGTGASGTIRFNGQTISMGVGVVLANSVAGVESPGDEENGGTGGSGPIYANYLISAVGTTTPNYIATQDGTLVTSAGYQVRLGISSTGTNEEFLAKTINITTDIWQHLAVTWDASESKAYFYLDGISIGTALGALTAIHNNASTLIVSGYVNAAAAKADFYNGLIDEVRIYNLIRTTAQILINKDVEVATNTAGLVAYYQLDNAATDSTANTNNLTLRNSVSYTTNVPFSAPTTRLDLDQELNTSGNTYTLATSISEGTTHRQTFIPAKDPQRSIQILIAAIGTGNWTVTVHDALNKTVASKTVAGASLNTGDYEFVFDDEWRPVIGATYHFHITSTVADGTVTTTTSADLETVDYHTYYQFLVNDDVSHMSTQFLNFVAICNSRYLGKLQAGPIYENQKITFPSWFRSRTLGNWNEYLAIGGMRGDTIYDYDQGMIFFWDGTKTTYNFYIAVPEGAVNAMYGQGGSLYFVAGYQGDVMVYTGGDKARKLFRLPKMSPDKYVEVLPGAITMFKSLLRIGYGVTNSSVIEQGVYTYGHIHDGEDDSLSYDYPVSSGTRASTSLQIGCLYPIDRKLLIGFKDGTDGAVDVVTPDADCFATGTIELLVRDEGQVSQDKQIQLARADFETLVTGQSITMKYRRDRAITWETDTAVSSTVYDTNVFTTASGARFNINSIDSRMKEYQIGIDVATTSGVSPAILSMTAGIEALASEEQL